MASTPEDPGEGWDPFLRRVDVDETIAKAVKASNRATTEPALYQPFATIANQITELFKEHCNPLTRRKIKFLGLGLSYIQGPPSYENGEPVKGTESQRKLDGLALLAGGLGDDARFKQHKAILGTEKSEETLDEDDPICPTTRSKSVPSSPKYIRETFNRGALFSPVVASGNHKRTRDDDEESGDQDQDQEKEDQDGNDYDCEDEDDERPPRPDKKWKRPAKKSASQPATQFT
ncbi:hypothetical protein FRB96_004079 [Tulasnella sp. 330]|nr:hypothetical protein FRB96_004079 [Tulasnella sp. 330]